MNHDAVEFYLKSDWGDFKATDRWIVTCLAGLSDEHGIIEGYTVSDLAQVCSYSPRDKWFRTKLTELAELKLIAIHDSGPSGHDPRLVLTVLHFLESVIEGERNVQ